jgi:hypothetical protein
MPGPATYLLGRVATGSIHTVPSCNGSEQIEHRLFSPISTNWRGRPLSSHEVVVDLIAAMTTRQGLKVRAQLDRGY